MKKTILFNFVIALGFLVLQSSCGGSKKSTTDSNKSSTLNNLVARAQMNEKVEGVCDLDNVYMILPLPGNGQQKAVAQKTKEEIAQDLNENVTFLKDKADYNDKGMVNVLINCKGELVQCKIDNKTQSDVLDDEIVAVFSKLKNWTSAKIHGKSVDSMLLFSFEITNGEITLK